MSTTITYKDNLLTTVDNSIKILRTAGKYLEGDIVVADITANKSQGNENDPIRFFDYDGTLVASYTEVPESLPEAPTHEGLIAQGWNWTLEDIATQFASSGACDVGQMYTTSDGRTRIHVTVSDVTKSFWLGLCPNGTLSIDWGDGSESSSMTGTSYTTIKTVYHEYTTTGSYVISVEAESGGFAFYNERVDYTRLLGKYESTGNYYNHPYGECVTAIELGDGVNINSFGFSNLFNMKSITISNGVTNIGIYAFNNCYALKSITIPNTVKTIATYAFQNCYNLESITIPDGVTSIGTYAFYCCYDLKSIAIPDSVNTIGNNVFAYCYALESIIIPDSVTNIGVSAFGDCYALKSVTISDGVTSIEGNTFKYCYALKSVTIPDGVTSIDSYAFNNCYTLKSATIPDSVNTIGTAAFSGCRILESVIIPDSVTNISTSAFSSCYALKSVTIPDGVTSIGASAFQSCYGMAEYHFLPTTPPTLVSTNAFNGIQSDCKMYVPYSADHSILEAYKTATNWSKYASYMVEEGE